MGKTSLLHAKVLPLLETEHWFSVYARPQDHPLKSLQTALASHLLPDPRDEAIVVDQLHEMWPESALSLDAAVTAYRALPHERRARLRLLMPRSEFQAPPLPMMCRALRGSIGVNDLIEHFEAMVADGPAMGVTPQTPLQDLASLLRHDGTVKLWEHWRGRFASSDGLAGALSVLDDDWAPLRPGMGGTILVLDQFEEVFTQLRHGTIETFLGETGRCLAACDAGTSGRPLHMALSMRKEFFADLVPLLQPFGAVERLTFFLGSMPADQARNAFSRPARMFGLTFAGGEGGAPGCIDGMLTLALDEGETPTSALPGTPPEDPPRLPADGRYAPTLISLIGAHLWARLDETKRSGAEPVGMPLSWKDFQRLVPHLDDVFTSFLDDALAQLDQSQAPDQPHASGATRVDALELLERLATSAGFRNIIAEEQLIEQLPLNRDASTALLDDMDRRLKLVRRERRHGGRFVEIMHERLIPPVRRMLADARRRDILRATLGPAYDMLYTVPDEADPDLTKDPLPSHFREALIYYLDRLSLDGVAAKNLLRSLLAAGPDLDTRSGGGWQKRWQQSVLRLAGDLTRSPDREAGRAPLLTGSKLDSAIGELGQRSRTPPGDVMRHLVLSVLADRSARAPERIRAAFLSIATLR